MKTAKYRYILNQYLLGAFNENDLVTLVGNGHISDGDRLEMITIKSGEPIV